MRSDNVKVSGIFKNGHESDHNITGTGYSNITIKNLLDMRSGLNQGCYDITEADEVGNCFDLPASQSVGGGDIAVASNQLTGCINLYFL